MFTFVFYRNVWWIASPEPLRKGDWIIVDLPKGDGISVEVGGAGDVLDGAFLYAPCKVTQKCVAQAVFGRDDAYNRRV